MLTRDRLMELFHDLKDRHVLSVYVDADQRDPALRDAWRIRMEGDVARLRRGLEKDDAGALQAFDSAWTLVADTLRNGGADTMSKRGWVAFATPDQLWHADAVPAHMPSLVVWQRGMRAAPYVRALKQERPVTVVLVDGRRARVFEQVEGEIREVEGVLADTDVGDLADTSTSTSRRAGRTSGVRGETSTDQGHRLMEVAAERLRKDLVQIVDSHAGQDGIVVVGGPPEASKALMALLRPHLPGRVTEWQSLHLDMTPAEIREQIRTAAGDLSEHGHQEMVSEVVDAARAGGKGSLGREDTMKALDELRVDSLLLSRTFIQRSPVVADLAVGLAFGQGADVEEVSGEAGERLDQEGGGIAARLRYL